VAVKLLRGKAFGTSDLAADLSGADPIEAIAEQTGTIFAGDPCEHPTPHGVRGSITATFS
jgi:hypothetical protein